MILLLLLLFFTSPALAATKTITIDSIQWQYALYHAEGADTIAIIFHAANSNGPDWCQHTGAVQALTDAGITVVCPSGCKARDYVLGFCNGGVWNAGAGDHPHANTLEQLGINQDVFIDWLIDKHAQDQQLVCTGFSNGSRACAYHAARRPDRFYRSLLISGPLTYESPWLPRSTHIISSRTDQHENAPQGVFPTFGGGKFSPQYFPARSAISWARSNGCRGPGHKHYSNGMLCRVVDDCFTDEWGDSTSVELCILEDTPHNLRAYNKIIEGGIWSYFINKIVYAD